MLNGAAWWAYLSKTASFARRDTNFTLLLGVARTSCTEKRLERRNRTNTRTEGRGRRPAGKKELGDDPLFVMSAFYLSSVTLSCPRRNLLYPGGVGCLKSRSPAMLATGTTPRKSPGASTR